MPPKSNWTLKTNKGTIILNNLIELQSFQVNSELLLSPGAHTKHEAQNSDKKRKDQSKYHETVQFKKGAQN